MQKQPLVVGSTVPQQVSVGNVVTPGGVASANGQQFRRVIIKTPQGQQQVLQRVTAATPLANPTISHVINSQGQKTLISQHSGTPLAGAKIIARTPQGLVTANPRIQNVSVTPQQAIRPSNSPKVTPASQLKNLGSNPTGVNVVHSQLPNSAGYQQVRGLASPSGVCLTNAVTTTSMGGQFRAATPQGTPKIVTVRSMTPNSTGQNPVIVNNKGEQVPVRVIKVTKTEGSAQRPLSTVSASTPSSGPRIVKIMTTPRGSSPLPTGQGQSGVRRVIMQSFTKAQTSSTETNSKPSQLAMLQSPQTVKTSGQVALNTTSTAASGTLSNIISVNSTPLPVSNVTTLTVPNVPLTTVCDSKSVTLTQNGMVSGESAVTSGSQFQSASAILSKTGNISITPTSGTSKASIPVTNTTKTIPNVNISSGNIMVNVGNRQMVSNIGDTKTGNMRMLTDISGTTVKKENKEFRQAVGSPEVIVIDDGEDETVVKKEEKSVTLETPKEVLKIPPIKVEKEDSKEGLQMDNSVNKSNIVKNEQVSPADVTIKAEVKCENDDDSTIKEEVKTEDSVKSEPPAEEPKASDPPDTGGMVGI